MFVGGTGRRVVYGMKWLTVLSSPACLAVALEHVSGFPTEFQHGCSPSQVYSKSLFNNEKKNICKFYFYDRSYTLKRNFLFSEYCYEYLRFVKSIFQLNLCYLR